MCYTDATMGRLVVRFYKRDKWEETPSPAVLHRLDCPYVMHRELEVYVPLRLSDGWWQRYRSTEEARRAAEVYRYRSGTRKAVMEEPKCCRRAR